MQNDTTYQFINDPMHKENLSGRVTAACINCRQKKIKCSGEVDCKQCQEKGLMCEGPPSRKRPKRDSQAGAPSSETAGSGTSVRYGDAAPDTKSTSPPTIQRPASVHQHDSGYASHGRGSLSSTGSSFSGPPSQPTESSRTEPAQTTRPMPNQRAHQHTVPAWDHSEGEVSPSSAIIQASIQTYTQAFAEQTQSPDTVSPAATNPSEWSPESHGASHGPAFRAPAASYTIPGPTSQAPMTAAPMMPEMREAPSHQSIGRIWPDEKHAARSPDQLIQAAAVLEDQAASLRQLALYQRSIDINARALENTRTLQQPMSPPNQMSNPDQMAFGAMASVVSQAPYEFDTSSIFRLDGSLRSGLTPGDDGYTPWHLDFQQPALPQHDASFAPYSRPPLQAQLDPSAQRSIGSGSPLDGTGTGRMQRVFHGQLSNPRGGVDPQGGPQGQGGGPSGYYGRR